MKFHQLLIINLVFLITNLLISCSGEKEIQQTGKIDSSTGNYLLWKIEGNNLNQPSYLYGTIHMIPQSDFSITDATRNAIDNAEVIVMEIKLDADAQMKAAMGAMFPMTSGITIEDYMTEEEYQQFSVFLSDSLKLTPLELAVYKRMKPIFLTQVMIKDILGEDPASFELEFIKIAEEKEMEIVGLESVNDQIGFFDSIPIDVQVQVLMESLNDLQESRNTYLQMVRYYKAQQLDSLAVLINDDDMLMEYGNLLLDNRNKNWIPILKKVMAAQPAFIAVGAGHLPGENGVINLLRAEGYTVTPVK